MASCPPPLITVRDYFRAPPRRRRAKPAAGTKYWTCVRNGQTCGTHHRDKLTALKHSARLDTLARRTGKRATWNPEQRTA